MVFWLVWGCPALRSCSASAGYGNVEAEIILEIDDRQDAVCIFIRISISTISTIGTATSFAAGTGRPTAVPAGPSQQKTPRIVKLISHLLINCPERFLIVLYYFHHLRILV
jgi:hypothetical protein